MVLLFSVVWNVLLLPVQSTDYPYGLYLDRDHRLDFKWNVDYELGLVRFKITVVSLTGEWFGVGFSDHGETNNADFMIYWTSAKNVHHFQDAWTDSDSFLHVDKHQDYHLVKALSQTGSPTVLQFYREIDTCDPRDYRFDVIRTTMPFIVDRAKVIETEMFRIQ
ncbi:hypothetical protein CHS0354_012275 [Potamilus streckersoni]|uniref:DOMON domain-containing protein n=1 Tax=Potamilus streckersoni TaxID=2493646 RepID=A0AAE0W4G6_9BIVA|nr:hypothetical protein CHS0354_012275 [Potamilus streckersoni]